MTFLLILLNFWTAVAAQQTPTLTSSWEDDKLRLEANVAGCIYAKPRDTGIACDFDGGVWWVRVSARGDSQDTVACAQNRSYELRDISNRVIATVGVPPYCYRSNLPTLAIPSNVPPSLPIVFYYWFPTILVP